MPINAVKIINKLTKHPLPIIKLPIFLCLPLLVSGIPICLEMFCLTLVMPSNLFQENPPLFILFSYLFNYKISS